MKRRLKHTVYVTNNDAVIDYTKIDGARTIPGKGIAVPVFAYEVVKSEQRRSEGHLRLFETLRIYAPPGYFYPGQPVGFSADKIEWRVQGNAEDSNASPWWSSGLAIYYAEIVR